MNPVDCNHSWTNNVDGLLGCGECGELWPGDPDYPPAPFASRNPGYGALRDQPGWNARVQAMVSELEAVS